MNNSSDELFEVKLLGIKLVALDVDGVLTDGLKYYGSNGLINLTFHARDGLGIYLLLRAGCKVAFVTNDRSNIIRKRAADLGITELLEEVDDKRIALRNLKRKVGVDTKETLYVGDDIWDLAAFEEAGVRVAVADAIQPVKVMADWVTQSDGGKGAIREIVDKLLNAKGIDPLKLVGIDSNDKNQK